MGACPPASPFPKTSGHETTNTAMQQVQGTESHVSRKKTHMKVVICTYNPNLGLSCLELRPRQGEGIVGALCLILSFHKLNLQTLWSQTHDSISSDQWYVKQDVEQDVKQDVDERWSAREQTIDSQRRPLRGLLPFFLPTRNFLTLLLLCFIDLSYFL